MSVVIDVALNNFKQFLLEENAFFYVETNLYFVLLKPFDHYFMRCYVVKFNDERDLLFKANELTKGMACKRFDFNTGVGVKDIERVLRDKTSLTETKVVE